MTDTSTDKKLSERFAEARDAKVFSGALLDEVQATLRLAESHPSAIRAAVEGERERCSICDEIVEIDDERIRQEERGFVDSPGGFEHMGDVWNQISKWAAAIRARGEEKENG